METTVGLWVDGGCLVILQYIDYLKKKIHQMAPKIKEQMHFEGKDQRAQECSFSGFIFMFTGTNNIF